MYKLQYLSQHGIVEIGKFEGDRVDCIGKEESSSCQLHADLCYFLAKQSCDFTLQDKELAVR